MLKSKKPTKNTSGRTRARKVTPGSKAATREPQVQRNTQQLRAVMSALEAYDRPLTPAEIWKTASKAVPSVSLATVYRLIKKLQASQELVAVELPSQPPRYEVSGKRHHHHFLCGKCDRIYDLPQCKANFDHLAPPGFKVKRHEVFLSGSCKQCA